MRTTSVRASGSLVVAVFVMASWIALLCETRCLVPERFHGELPPFAGWSSDADPVPQHHHPVPSQVKLCILALPGTGSASEDQPANGGNSQWSIRSPPAGGRS